MGLESYLLTYIICKTRENSNFLKKGKLVILVKIRNFFRSRMTKQTSPVESFREIYLLRRISLNSKIVGISRFSRHGESAGHLTLDTLGVAQEVPRVLGRMGQTMSQMGLT